MKYARLLVALSSAGLSTAATICNGYSELCTKLYPDVSVVGAHNSYTASNTNLAANQDYGVTQQLTDGVRLLQNQVHLQNGQLTLCHTSCLLYDGGLLSGYLTKVQTWMNSNPTEIVTLLLVNIDNQPVTSFASVYAALGLDKLSFSPQGATTEHDAWPSYGALIDAGTRLVTFMDNSASFASVPYIIDEFSNMWEDYYDVENPSGFNCTIQRATGDTDGRMYLINHYLYEETELFGGTTPVPNKTALPVTNAVSGAGSLGQEAEVTCVQNHGYAPTFLLVDFYDWGGGSVFEVAATLNNVTYQAKSIAPQNGTDGTSSGSTGTTSTTSAAQAGRVTLGAFGAVLGTILGSLLMV